MNIPKDLIVHHSLVSREKNNEQYDAIDRYHKSKGWGMIGYHYLIEPNGEVKEGRRENQRGAHTSQKLMNFRSLGICLAGNFDIEEPTIEQCRSLYTLLRKLQSKYGIADNKVVPHRHYATYKSCWGRKLPDNILGYLDTRLTAPKFQVPKWAEESLAYGMEPSNSQTGKAIITNDTDLEAIYVTPYGEAMLYRAGLISENSGKGLSKYRLMHLIHKQLKMMNK